MKKLTVRQFATVKRVAQNVNPLVVKKHKIEEKIEALQIEKETLQNEINGHEAGIQTLTGGYTSEELVQKVVETTNKTDKDGNIIKVTKYLPTDLVSYSEDDNCYYINDIRLKAKYSEVPSTEGMTGSDFDIDSDNL